ncbi:MAG: DUF952 domain-containing protein [SAR202 cluster bacterium]|nr:DUF952 domain-containing protein [SAR202 cluster bacterium]
MPIICHLITQSDWQQAQGAAEYRAPSLALEGFIHCSQDEAQLLRVAQRLYAGRRDMMALDVDTARLTSPIKREPSRSGELYPHIYGPLNTSAVTRVRPLLLDAQANFYLGQPE